MPKIKDHMLTNLLKPNQLYEPGSFCSIAKLPHSFPPA